MLVHRPVAGMLGIGSPRDCGSPVERIAPFCLMVPSAAFNFFRPSGPTHRLPGWSGATAISGARAWINFPLGFISDVRGRVPWSDVDPQSSNGNSIYHALTVTVTKRFSHGFQMVSGWTYRIRLTIQPISRRLSLPRTIASRLDRGNSDFDQRHRWITSAVYQTPRQMRFRILEKFFSGFTVSPIIEVSSGRPFNLLLGEDTNLDFGSSTGRPSVQPATAPPGSRLRLIFHCLNSSFRPLRWAAEILFRLRDSMPFDGCTGDLGRNAFNQPGFFQIDLRIAKAIPSQSE